MSGAQLVARLISIDGIRNLSATAGGALSGTYLIGGFIVFGTAWRSLERRRLPPSLDLFALLTAAAVVAAFLWAPDYYTHYAGFAAPFIALSVGLTANSLVARRERTPNFVPAVVGLAAIALAILAALQFHRQSRLAGWNPAAAAQREIPAGACVLTDYSSYTIVANRFISHSAGCPAMVDALGTDIALSRGRNAIGGAGSVPVVTATWLSAFMHADYVWLNCLPAGAPACDQSTNRRIPWTRPIRTYFSAHFRPVAGPVPYLYVRDG